MAKRTKRLLENEESVVEAVRLNKFLSDAGICSRREADRYIEEGKVLVDGEIAEAGMKVTSDNVVTYKGKVINKDEKLVLIALNKPRGIVCTTDRREKDNIVDFVGYGSRIYPIGRLDKDSEGLILLTNDGNIVNKILRAGNNHDKEYIVTINGNITQEFLKGMAAGVPILDTVTKPCKIKALDKNTFQIIITQGLNRQIRRMCEYFGYKVVTLKRVRIMNINLGHLQLGGYRNVTEKEIESLNLSLSDSMNDVIDMGGYDDDENEFSIPQGKQGKKKSDYKAQEFRKNSSDTVEKKTSRKVTEKKGTGQNAKGTRNPNSKINKRIEERKRLAKDAREATYTGEFVQGKRVIDDKKAKLSEKKRLETKFRAEKNRLVIPDKDFKDDTKYSGGFGKKKSRQDKDLHPVAPTTRKYIKTDGKRGSDTKAKSNSSARGSVLVEGKKPWKQPNQNRNFDVFIKGGKR